MPFPSQRRDHAGPSEFTSSPKRIAVLYYCPGYRTRTPRKRVLGHVRQLALKIKEGAEAAGAEVDVFQVVAGPNPEKVFADEDVPRPTSSVATMPRDHSLLLAGLYQAIRSSGVATSTQDVFEDLQPFAALQA